MAMNLKMLQKRNTLTKKLPQTRTLEISAKTK